MVLLPFSNEQIKSLQLHKYYYSTIILKVILFYCIPNIFIANGFVAVGCYSWILYTKYIFIANSFVAIGCQSCLLYTKKVLLQMVFSCMICPTFALNKSCLGR